VRHLRTAWAIVVAFALALASPVGAEFVVNADTSGVQRRPAVAADGLGNFVVVWRHDDFLGNPIAISGRRFDPAAAPLGADFQVNTTTTYPTYPDVAADAAGDFVVVWQSGMGTGADVLAQRYDGAGSPVGVEFQVNSSTTGLDETPTVAMDAAGNFVVAWTTGQIMARRYDAAGVALGSEF
jgi:hypothetical protein